MNGDSRSDISPTDGSDITDGLTNAEGVLEESSEPKEAKLEVKPNDDNLSISDSTIDSEEPLPADAMLDTGPESDLSATNVDESPNDLDITHGKENETNTEVKSESNEKDIDITAKEAEKKVPKTEQDKNAFPNILDESETAEKNSKESKDSPYEQNDENQLAKGEKPEYNSTKAERLQQTPTDDPETKKGEWEGERGESVFHSDDDEANEILRKYGVEGIKYANAIPDFSPVSEGTVKISDMSDSRPNNFRQADIAEAERRGCTPREVTDWRTANDFTWHERNDMKTCDLIPTKINSTFGHLGGVSECKKRNDGTILKGNEFDE